MATHRNISTRLTRATAASLGANLSPAAAQPARFTQGPSAPASRSRGTASARTARLPASSLIADRLGTSHRQSTSNPEVGAAAHSLPRKRTRSASRRAAGHQSGRDNLSSAASPSPVAEPQASSSVLPPSTAAVASAAFVASLSGRPSKRRRRSSRSNPNSRGSPRLSGGPKTSGGASASRMMNREVNITGTQGGADDSQPEQSARRNSNDDSSTLGGTRVGASTLQGLLRRLGADLSDVFPSSTNNFQSRLQQLRTSIATPESDEQQIDALAELCEFLSVGTEESLVSFSVNLFVAPLVNLLRNKKNIEIKIYAARALTHMMEALPSSSSSIANHGAAEPLCENLLSIEYIDLAEQSLSALQKLSVDHPQQVVSANGFQAVLSFIDFFSIGMQRVAAATVCNLCRLPQADAMDRIAVVLSAMMQLLDSSDQRIRESAVLGFTRLADSFRSSSSKLEGLCGHDSVLIEKVLTLIVPHSPPALTPQSYSSALRLLATLSRGSAKLGLLILSKEPLVSKMRAKLGSGSSEHSVDCLVLADSLLPDIPEVTGSHGSLPRSRRKRNVGSAAAYAAVDATKRENLEEDSQSIQLFGRSLFGTLMKFYTSSADSNARRIALSVMSKFISIASRDVLAEISPEEEGSGSHQHWSNGARFGPFVATLLGENSSRYETLIGLAITDSALSKLPSLRDSFVREGVIHEVVRLAAFDDEPMAEAEASTQQNVPHSALDVANSSESVVEPRDATDSLTGNPGRPTGILLPGTVGAGDTDSIWTAVAAIHRGSSFRDHRSHFLQPPHRLPRNQDGRFSDTQMLHLLASKGARSILTTHLGAQADGTMEENILRNVTLGKLDDICKLLRSCASGEEAQGKRALSQLVCLLTTAQRLTVFEVSKSGLIDALALFFSPADQGLQASRISSLLECFSEVQGLGAFSSLVDLALGVLASDEKLVVQSNEFVAGTASASVASGLRQLSQPLRLRLRKASDGSGHGLRDYSHNVVLIEPLATMASVQEFLWPRVRVGTGSESGRGSANLRIRTTSRDERTERRNSSANDHEEEIEANEPDGNGSNPQREGLAEDPYAEDVMFQMEEDNEEADDEDRDVQNSDPSDEEVSSGEEDVIGLDGVESDEHEHDRADAFDFQRIGMPSPPVELDHDTLGQAPARSLNPQSAVLPAGAASHFTTDPTATFRSYAAALAANVPRSFDGAVHFTGIGMASTETRSGQRRREVLPRPSRSPKLNFVLQGKQVPHDASILSAVIQSSQASRGIGPRLWSDVHTLLYSQVNEASPIVGNVGHGVQESAAGNSGLSASHGSDGALLRRSQRLKENRAKSSSGNLEKMNEQGIELSSALLPRVTLSRALIPTPLKSSESSIPSSIRPIVEVLNQLHWIHEKMSERTLTKEGLLNQTKGLSDGEVVKFHSNKISAKLMRQLSDPLALCAGLPSWCFTLSREFTFLVPFETRRVLFQSTALGVFRALFLLQERADLTGAPASSHRGPRGSRPPETRIGRMQRQKVRIHRDRLLESAIKVINTYSTHSTQLEVQYFGEAGTGLGPTLEFFTLASREVQRMDLGLWRDNSTKANKHERCSLNMSQTIHRTRSKSDIETRAATVKRRSRSSAQGAHAQSADRATDAEECPAYVNPSGNGLFPSCLPTLANESQREASARTTALFEFVGRLLGKAVIDGRLLDLRFSNTFSRLLLAYCRVFGEKSEESLPRSSVGNPKSFKTELDAASREKVWSIFTASTSAMTLLKDVDPQLASSLSTVLDLARKGEREAVEGLCLTFVLPGNDEVELLQDGANISVSEENAEEFVRRVAFHALFGGVHRQAEALLRGLGEVLNVTSLLAFESDELELLVCGPSFEEWTVDFLVQATRCDHGYSHESPSVMYFLRILAELNQADQQRFVLFTTGSPSLPLGGLRNLHPKLTIVRRTPEAGRSADECLPTVMTCTNYFKLPDYSSFEIARKQVMYAVREGQGSFHLS